MLNLAHFFSGAGLMEALIAALTLAVSIFVFIVNGLREAIKNLSDSSTAVSRSLGKSIDGVRDQVSQNEKQLVKMAVHQEENKGKFGNLQSRFGKLDDKLDDKLGDLSKQLKDTDKNVAVLVALAQKQSPE